MKIYKLNITAYDYWYSCERSGFVTVSRYFSTKEKAENWIVKNPKYIYRGFKNQTEAEEEREMPKFEIVEIEVE